MTAQNTSKNSTGLNVEVMKSGSVAEILEPQYGLVDSNEYGWPVSPIVLLGLYQAASEHTRAIHLKAEGAYGRGLMGSKADQFDELCESDSADMFTDLGVDQETFGNAYLQIIKNEAKRIIRLRRLPAATMKRKRNGGFVQKIWVNSKERRTHFRQDEIVHLRHHCPHGHYYSLPDWISAGQMIELVEAATKWNKKFFKNGAIPEYAIITKGSQLSTEQKEATKAFFQRDFQGVDNSHRTILIHMSDPESDVEFKKITEPMKDADFLKLLDAAKDRIPIAHGVPPRLLGIMHAGQLGGGNELTGQLFQFEIMKLDSMRRRMLSQLKPLLRELGIDKDELSFVPLDLTPPDQDKDDLAELVDKEILSAEEARTLLPYYEQLKKTSVKTNSNADSGDKIKKSNDDSSEVLFKLLERL